jgi:hypothetical protein
VGRRTSETCRNFVPEIASIKIFAILLSLLSSRCHSFPLVAQTSAVQRPLAALREKTWCTLSGMQRSRTRKTDCEPQRLRCFLTWSASVTRSNAVQVERGAAVSRRFKLPLTHVPTHPLTCLVTARKENRAIRHHYLSQHPNQALSKKKGNYWTLLTVIGRYWLVRRQPHRKIGPFSDRFRTVSKKSGPVRKSFRESGDEQSQTRGARVSSLG